MITSKTGVLTMKIAVLYGGVSGEREVSLSTGKGIIEALKHNQYDVIEIDFHPRRIHEIIQLDVDLIFIGLHGKYGEDGRIQGLLDMLEIPYVGSDVLASALAMDKDKSKQIFQKHNIPVAESNAYKITKGTHIDQVVSEINKQFIPPFVIKPNREGSTLGLTIVNDIKQVKDAITKAIKSDDVI